MRGHTILASKVVKIPAERFVSVRFEASEPRFAEVLVAMRDLHRVDTTHTIPAGNARFASGRPFATDNELLCTLIHQEDTELGSEGPEPLWASRTQTQALHVPANAI